MRASRRFYKQAGNKPLHFAVASTSLNPHGLAGDSVRVTILELSRNGKLNLFMSPGEAEALSLSLAEYAARARDMLKAR